MSDEKHAKEVKHAKRVIKYYDRMEELMNSWPKEMMGMDDFDALELVVDKDDWTVMDKMIFAWGLGLGSARVLDKKIRETENNETLYG